MTLRQPECYFYALLLLFQPWRDDAELKANEETVTSEIRKYQLFCISRPPMGRAGSPCLLANARKRYALPGYGRLRKQLGGLILTLLQQADALSAAPTADRRSKRCAFYRSGEKTHKTIYPGDAILFAIYTLNVLYKDDDPPRSVVQWCSSLRRPLCGWLAAGSCVKELVSGSPLDSSPYGG